MLTGHRIVVTGAGGGLGGEISRTLAELGAVVHLWGRREASLAEVNESLESIRPGSSVAQSVDVRDADAVEAAFDAAEELGPVTGVVNGAAANFVAPTAGLSPRAYRAVVSTVMDGSYNTTHAAGTRWIAAGRPGAVVSLLTSWVWTGSAYVVPSAMAKAAVHAMTLSLAAEWAQYGIRLNAIAPGPVHTDFAWQMLDPGRDDVVAATDPRGVPLGRLGTPQEVANLVAFLLSDACDYLTGETIAMDGAQRLAGPATFAPLAELRDEDWMRIRERARAASEANRPRS
ncbi:SDR family oxidoreductase [Leifsonia poae]|uniref:SDR family oxidoreductase n=1 Tax=Leifsonia poae TaxID=110933 RepID=UPI003D67CC53